MYATALRHRDFNPRPPRGGRHGQSTCATITITFQSTPPARGATPPPDAVQLLSFSPISIHAPREGGDICVVDWCTQHQNFNPRPPRGGRRLVAHRLHHKAVEFQSTPPARGATFTISLGHTRRCVFQSTPPARGATSLFSADPQRNRRFQSTPPARGATVPVDNGN